MPGFPGIKGEPVIKKTKNINLNFLRAIKAEMDLLGEKASLECQVLKAMLVYQALLVCLEEKVYF